MVGMKRCVIVSGYRIAATGLMCMALLCGCGHGGPERVVVSGQVTYQGQPVEEGSIRFLPKAGTQLPVSGGPIRDGEYVVQAKGGVPVGTHVVRITATRPDPNYRPPTVPVPDGIAGDGVAQLQYIPEKYNRRTELKMTVPAGSRRMVQDFHLTE